MELTTLSAISPVDGRYRNQTAGLAEYFSEEALMRFRLIVEIEYLIALAEIPLPGLKDLKGADFKKFRSVYEGFSSDSAMAIKGIEGTTNHDVKAVEYYIREKLTAMGYESAIELIHFGLTSQDVNNTAFPFAFRQAMEKVYYPELNSLTEILDKMAAEWKEIPMLSRTHGQPASPTRLGKEFMVFLERINNQLGLLRQIPFVAKFGGATGNFNAHHVAFPKVDWKKFSDDFVSAKLGLKRLTFTTQIEHYDNLCALFDGLKRINNILIDLNRDLWTYISMDYFKQAIKPGEIGSSAMPHKVNPIDFENSEGNLGIANSFFEHLSAKLPISRLQRDLTDSTVLRNAGVPFAHTLIALKSLRKGLNKLIVNGDAINRDLGNNWAVVAEALQTILRRENFPDPYGKLKELTRTHEAVTKESLHTFIDGLNVSAKVKEEMKGITPFNYTGI